MDSYRGYDEARRAKEEALWSELERIRTQRRTAESLAERQREIEVELGLKPENETPPWHKRHRRLLIGLTLGAASVLAYNHVTRSTHHHPHPFPGELRQQSRFAQPPPGHPDELRNVDWR